MPCFPQLDHPPPTRDAKSSIPVGWTPCRGVVTLPETQASHVAIGQPPFHSDHKVVYRCPKETNVLRTSGNLEVERRRCTWTARRDRITNIHSHRYDCAPQHDSMMIREAEVKERAEEDRSEVFTARVLRTQTVGFARVGVSLAKMASPAVQEMTTELVQIGIDLQSRSPGTHLVASDYVRSYDRTMYQEELLAAHERERDHLLQEYARMRFVNIKVDAGTVLRAHCTHGIVDSPYSGFPPWIYAAQVNDGWSTDNYSTYVRELLDYLRRHAPGIIVTSIVHDNLPAQANAIDVVVSELDGCTIDVPCFNHMLNLVFTHSVRDNKELNQGVRMALAYQRLMREANKPAPSIPKTRWLYIVELLECIEEAMPWVFAYCIEHSDVAPATFDCTIGEVHQYLQYVYAALKPLQKMSLRLERDDATYSIGSR